MRVTEEQLYLWRQQIVVDRVQELEKGCIITKEDLAIYSAGMRSGMAELLATLKLHGVI